MNIFNLFILLKQYQRWHGHFRGGASRRVMMKCALGYCTEKAALFVFVSWYSTQYLTLYHYLMKPWLEGDATGKWCQSQLLNNTAEKQHNHSGSNRILNMNPFWAKDVPDVSDDMKCFVKKKKSSSAQHMDVNQCFLALATLRPLQ